MSRGTSSTGLVAAQGETGVSMTGNTGGGGGGSRRHYWGVLILLALCCSGLYILLYYRVSLTTTSALLFPRAFCCVEPSPATENTTTPASRSLLISAINKTRSDFKQKLNLTSSSKLSVQEPSRSSHDVPATPAPVRSNLRLLSAQVRIKPDPNRQPAPEQTRSAHSKLSPQDLIRSANRKQSTQEPIRSVQRMQSVQEQTRSNHSARSKQEQSRPDHRLQFAKESGKSGLRLQPVKEHTRPDHNVQSVQEPVRPSHTSQPAKESSKPADTVQTSQQLKDAIARGNAPPLLTLFSTWVDRSDLALVRKLTLQNWNQLKPYVIPVLFTNDSKMAAQAEENGWHTLPVTKMAVGVPVLKNMYLDARQRFNSTLYAFANGDILFTDGLIDSLATIMTDRSLLQKQSSVLVIGQRSNVNMVTAQEAATFESITRVAKSRGKLFTTMAEDFFITNRDYPWDSIPGVVIGRVAYDNWLVLHAIQSGHVVVDITKTAPAVHQTTRAGNFEGFTHANASYNDNVLKRLYKRIQYGRGCVDCAPWLTRRSSDGKIVVEKRTPKPKHC